MQSFKLVPLFLFFASCSNVNTLLPEEKELNIGSAEKIFKLPSSGNDLLKYLNTKLLTDSSRNLISQLGAYRFSTSIDAANTIESRYNPDVFIYYDYEGLQLRYVFKGAGILKREELQTNLEAYKKYIYLDQLMIEPKLFKGALPYYLSKEAGPITVQQKLGKHNTFFETGDATRKLSYTYPEKGLFILFESHPGPVNFDSTMEYITITDSILEMKRYPTLYPKYADSTR